MNNFKFTKTFKTISLALALTTACAAFSACGTKTNDKNADGQTMISISDWPEKDGALKDEAEDKKSRFSKDNPDVAVSGDNWKFDLKSFYAKAAGGQLPTVYQTHFTEASAIIDAGYSADITDELKKRGLDTQFNKQILDIVSKDGKVYAYPYSAYALGMAYNVDLFKKAGLMEADGTPKQPKDWNELAEFAVKIKEATGKPGFVFPTSNNYGGWMFMPIAWSYGVNFMEKEDGKWKAKFDCQEAVDALQYIKDLKWKYDVLPSNSLIDGTEYYKIFGTNEAGMLLSAADISNQLTSYDFDPKNLGMFAMPSGPKKHVTLLGGALFAIAPSSTEAQVEAGMRWITYSGTTELTDTVKEQTVKSIETDLAQNKTVGIIGLSIWDKDTPTVKYNREMREKMSNINMNQVKLYNDFVADLGDCELKAEEPVCAQELYATLDSCIQEVLVNKDADCAALIKKAAADFQSNYLDNVDY